MAAKRTTPTDTEQAPGFEQALERLEAIVEELEGGTLSLEDSIARYEEGMKLSRHLGRTLDAAEKRIERLVVDDSGAPATEPMSLDDDAPALARPATPAPAAAAPDSPPAPRTPGPPVPPELPF